MCATCLSTVETALVGTAFGAYVVKAPVHRALARLGVAADPDPVAHDATTVAFLRGLELDPVVVLGADVVAAADAWARPQRVALVPALAALARSARPIPSVQRRARRPDVAFVT